MSEETTPSPESASATAVPDVVATSTAAPAEARPAEATEKKAAKTASDEIIPVYGWTFYLMRFLYRQYFRLGGWKIFGGEHVPKTGAIVIAPNHASLLDPPLVGCATPRRVMTMGKAELFDQKWLGIKILGYIITRMATFPVKRGSPDRRAIRRAAQLLKDGEALVIFPEGTRTRTGELGSGEIGLAMIAHNAKAPIVPMYLGGTGKALSPFYRGFRIVKVEVRFGKPLYFEEEYSRKADKATLQSISDRVMQEIGKLKDEATIK